MGPKNRDKFTGRAERNVRDGDARLRGLGSLVYCVLSGSRSSKSNKSNKSNKSTNTNDTIALRAPAFFLIAHRPST